jgi:hypothetical protein
MIQYLKVLVNKDHPVTVLSPQDGEFINSKVMAWWYLPQKFASGEVEYGKNQFSFFLLFIRTRKVP